MISNRNFSFRKIRLLLVEIPRRYELLLDVEILWKFIRKLKFDRTSINLISN